MYTLTVHSISRINDIRHELTSSLISSLANIRIAERTGSNPIRKSYFLSSHLVFHLAHFHSFFTQFDAKENQSWEKRNLNQANHIEIISAKKNMRRELDITKHLTGKFNA